MNKLSRHEANCSLSSVELFDDRLRQEDVIGGGFEKINPINSLDGTQVIEFLVKGNEDFIDMHNCYLQLKIKVTNEDGTDLAAGGEISLINYPIATLFHHVDVYLNNDLVTNTNNYEYKAYMEMMLTYSEIAKGGWLQASAYFKDTHGRMDTLGNANTGFRYRKGLIEESKTVQLMGKIHSDMFNQERLLLNHVDLKVVFTRNSDSFCTMSAAALTGKIEFVDAVLVVRRNKLASHKVNEVQTTLQKQDVKYFIPRTEVKTYTFAAGLRNISVRNSVTERDIPNRIVVGLVSNTTYNGSKALNPFNFKHYNMTSADITVDTKSVYGKPMFMHIGSGQFMEPFWTMQHGLGFIYQDDGCGITRNEYDNGYFLLAADLSATLCNGQYDDPVQSGNVDIELKFGEALPETGNMIIYMEFSSTISINAARKAVKNFV